MSTQKLKTTLTEERRRIEERQPGLAQSYQEFLQSYGRYREMQRQFATKPDERKPEVRLQLRSSR